MAAYIVVYEDYSPELFTTAKAMGARFSGHFLDEENTVPATAQAITEAVKAEGSAYIYTEGGSEWAYKVFPA